MRPSPAISQTRTIGRSPMWRSRTEAVLGLMPMAQPQLAPFRCVEPEANQADEHCGGEVWSYDDNDLGRQHARALGIPTR